MGTKIHFTSKQIKDIIDLCPLQKLDKNMVVVI